MKPVTKVHIGAATISILTIATFWLSTVISELFMSLDAVVAVKTFIFYGLWLLIPAIIITAGSGNFMARNHKHSAIARKKKRMPFIALNGILILVPSAIFLYTKAINQEFDGVFYTVQMVELIAGLINLTLMIQNAKDGKRIRTKPNSPKN
jgi:hypothetical protein